MKSFGHLTTCTEAQCIVVPCLLAVFVIDTVQVMSSCVIVIGLDELEEEHCRLWAGEVTAFAKTSKQLPPIVAKCSPSSGNIILAKLISSCVTCY